MSTGHFNAYLDESGNTGRDYLAEGQPFFVLGGWAIDDAIAGKCRSVVADWEHPFLRKGTKEPKASSILKHSRGVDQIIDLMAALLKIGAAPTGCVFEKRFGICMNISEAFFGIVLHGEGFSEAFRDERGKNEIASIMCEALSDQTLRSFASAAFDKNMDAFRAAKRRIISELDTYGRADMVGILDVIPEEASAAYLFSGDGSINPINATVFQTQLSMLEHFARQRGVERWTIKHDRIPEFEEVFVRTTTMLTSMPNSEVRLNNGSVIYTGKLRLEGLDFIDSASDELVRAADCYSSLIKFVFTKQSLEQFSGVRKVAMQNLLDSMILGFPPLNFRSLTPKTDMQFLRWLRS